MTFEEWWNTYMYLGDYLDKELAQESWEAGYQVGMENLVKAHQIRPRGKSIITLHELHHRMQSDDF